MTETRTVDVVQKLRSSSWNSSNGAGYADRCLVCVSSTKHCQVLKDSLLEGL